jgi:hypothetical protein
MLGKFTKAEARYLADAQQHIREAVDALREPLDAGEVAVRSPDELAAHAHTLQHLYEHAVALCTNVASFMATFAEDQQSQYDEKSENWQEGDRGQQVSSWIDALAELAEPEFAPFEITEDETTHRLPSDEEGDDFHKGLPVTFPAFVDFSYSVYTDDLVTFADSLENLPESANDM